MSAYSEVLAGVPQTWPYRVPLVVDNSAGSFAAPKDVAFTVPTDWDDFWLRINQTDGRDIRVTGSDGATLSSFKLTGFTLVGRVLTINVQNGVNLTSSHPGVTLWLYWGNTSVAACTYAAFAPATPFTAYALLDTPAPDVRLRWLRGQVGDTKPAQRFQKTPSAQVLVAIEYRSILGRRTAPYGGGYQDEEPQDWDYSVYNAAGSAQAAMVDKTLIRADERFVYVLVKAGSDATTYTLSVTMTTCHKNTGSPARVLEMRALVEVSDLIP